MSDQSATSSATDAVTAPGKVVILYKSKASPDADLAVSLESGLRRLGHVVFMEHKTAVGLTWAHELEQHLGQADLVIALVSAASAQSELLAYELEVANQVAEKRGGLPRILPVRVFYKGPLSEALSALLQPIEFVWAVDEERYRSRMVIWGSAADDKALVALVNERLGEVASVRSGVGVLVDPEERRAVPTLEPLGGAVPLDSKFYIERRTDVAFRTAVDRRDSLVLVKGARQMGKTSLLARGLQQARDTGCRVVMTDFQKLQASHFASIEEFYRALAEFVADQLDWEVPESQRWQRNPNVAFEQFWAKGLAALQQPVLWAADEFDRLFTSRFGGEVCGLLRSWHNARALDPTSPWRHLTIAIAYATEAHLFINDLNQSPFNVGTRLNLGDFSDTEVSELNTRYGRPLSQPGEIERLHQLLGGHPYLVRCAMNEMSNRRQGIALVERLVDEEESVFGEHLRRLLYSVGRDSAVTEALRGLLVAKTPPVMEVFYRLRSAGVVVGAGPTEARMRCELYAQYLHRHLVG